MLSNFYYLSPPNSKVVLLREKKIKACKLEMGDKWLLAKSIPRKDAK
jgi:hypothetical protein